LPNQQKTVRQIMVTGGSSAVAGVARGGPLPGMTTTRDDRAAPSGDPQRAGTQPAYRDRVADDADDADWTVLGTHPLSGRYHGKQEFIDATSERLAGVLPGGARLKVRSLYVDGDTTIVELLSTADEHCRWVCRFDGDRIVEARAYLDSMMVAYPISRDEHPPR
jgi:ketosteroid isomerase-like protein